MFINVFIGTIPAITGIVPFIRMYAIYICVINRIIFSVIVFFINIINNNDNL